LLGIVGAWLVVAQRTARRRADIDPDEGPKEARPAPVTADLPTSD
jgi:hypothetical protein